MKDIDRQLIPEQRIGSQVDAVEERVFKSLLEAQNLFNEASKRLLLVNEWERISGLSEFKLFDNWGEKLDRHAQEGDYIRIDIPGPGTVAGRGFDWVVIEKIYGKHDGDQDFISMTVRPSVNPQTMREETAHFLSEEATSTFVIRREKMKVWAEEHGRNEKANVAQGTLIDKGRNLIVGLAAKFGMSYPQWKLLVKGLLDGKP